MNRWVNFRVLKQSIGIEQVLASYRVELKHAGHNQLRGRCLELSRFLRQPVKTQFSINGELCYGIVSPNVHA